MSASRAPARPPQGAAPRPGGPQRGPMFSPHIEAPKDYRRTLRRLLGYFGAYRVLMIAATVFIAAGTLLRSLGPALIGEAIKYDLELSKNLPDFVHRMGIVLATILGSWIADAGAGILMTRLSNNIVYRLREDSFAHVQTLSMGSFDKRGIGDFISRMTNDIEMIFNAMNNGFSSLVGGLLSMIAVLVAMFVLSVPLSFVVIAVVPVMAVLTGIIGKKIRGAFRKNQEWVGRLTANIEESISGVKVIKTFRREEAEFGKFEKINNASQRVGVEAELISYAFMPLMNFMTSLTLAQAHAGAAAVFVNGFDAAPTACWWGRLLLQLSPSGVVRSLVPNSTSRRIASARDGRSFWRRRQSSTIRKNSSDTRIWNGRSCGLFEGRPGGRRLLVIIAYFVLTIHT